MASKTDWAWLAGLFEGEGTIQWRNKNSVVLKITLTDLDVLKRVQMVAGGQIHPERSPSRLVFPNRKPVWVWALGSAPEVRLVLECISPYLGERRQKRAKEAQQRLARTRRYSKRSTTSI